MLLSAKEKLLKFRPKYNSNNLLYCLPDSINTSFNLDFDFKKNNLYTFAVIGTLEPRKGYDVLLKSLESIDKEFKDKVQIVIVGKKCHEYIYNSIIENKVLKICYIESIDKDNMIDFYKQIDCLICPSLDDPMPIVVTEAWKYKIPVIISENTGSATLVNDYGGGLVYKSNDPVELASEINKVLFNKIDLNKLTSEGYNIYSKFFTKDIFDKNIENIIKNLNNKEEIITNELVSVVVPTYNGLNDIKTLINSLKKQKNINIEIIIVDSGSTDGTIEYLRSENVKLITIPNDKFTHSGARNLGASEALGKYLLFMTQDACPKTDTFVFEFLQPILRKEAVACMAKQTPRKDADLYARFAVYTNNQYIGLNKDLITEYAPNYDQETERKMAQLDDVSCIIDKDIFDKYKYKGAYAEDLELGTRLIKDGYNLYHMSDVEVIHSHTRNSFYFFSRSYIDRNYFSFESRYDKKLIDQGLSIYALILSIENDLSNVFENSFDWKSLESNLKDLFNKRSRELKKYNIDELIYNKDSISNDFKKNMISFYELKNKELNLDFTYLNLFVDWTIDKFIEFCKYSEKFENLNNDFYYEYLEKTISSFLGNLLAPVINYIKSSSNSNNLGLIKI